MLALALALVVSRFFFEEEEAVRGKCIIANEHTYKQQADVKGKEAGGCYYKLCGGSRTGKKTVN